MDKLTRSRHNDIAAETLNQLMDTDMLVEAPCSEYAEIPAVMDVGCLSRQDDPAKGNIGMRVVPGNAKGEARWTTNRPARNVDPATLAEETNDGDAEIFVPIQWVLAALDCDSVEELTEDDW